MKLSKSQLNTWSKLGPRAMFGQFMIELAKKNKKIIVLTADLGRSSGLARFADQFPDQYLSVGICEQNLIGISSGLAREGYKVFITSFAPFLSMRASEQIRMNLGYMKHNVNVVALGSGVSMGFLGNSHFGLEDIAVMRTIPNLNIICPSDCLELKKVVEDCSSIDRGPTYIRLTGVPGSKIVYEKDYSYKFIDCKTVKEGNDLLILSYGSILGEVIDAARMLENKNINAQIVNVKILKPFNEKILKLINQFKYLVIIEEHSSIGGLKSIISENLLDKNKNVKILALNLSDKFGPTGSYKYLLDYHNLSSEKIYQKILKFYKK